MYNEQLVYDVYKRVKGAFKKKAWKYTRYCPLTCDFCDKQFHNKNQIEEHLKEHTYGTVDMKY